MLNLNQFEGYTRGPWSRNIKPASHYPTIFAGRNTHVARVVVAGAMPESEVEANCELIAAVPTLLEELKLMREFVKRQDDMIGFLVTNFTDSMNNKQAKGYDMFFAAITTLKERLGV